MSPSGEGLLCVVGTPIGNLSDLSPAAEARLRTANIICAEDTRRTRGLLTAFGIRPARLVSVRSENEARSVSYVIGWLREGKEVALVTDAGMPGLSDPGERLIRGVLEAGGNVCVQPGPDAATTALALSGVPTVRWCFEGFLPRGASERHQRLVDIRREERAVVVFEAPHRLSRTLSELEAVLGGDRHVAVANDLTKLFERVWRGPLDTVRRSVTECAIRGEFVVVIAPDLTPAEAGNA